MAKVPKHRRIKRATVLIKRTRCIRNTKTKSYSPLYQKLKVNNHSLARALSQEKQESQLLFTRNVELLAEVQDLTHACNTRDLVIANILKNAKDMMQMLVTMSGYLTNTISSCQEFVSNSVNVYRTSTSSAGRRESTRRISTKSPARGVVKPMVSGHTITKPTINLSRVNMQRLQNVNLSIIEEGPVSPERNIDRSVESRRSRTLPERLPVSALRNEEDEERVIVNRTSRFSGSRLSSRRYSKRNSGRLSGRLSKRSSDYSELIKSPRVALQDVSRYLANNQTVNIRAFSENANASQNVSNETSIEDTQMNEQSSPENQNSTTIIPETQESSESDEDTKNNKKRSSNKSSLMESDLIDPMEGPSWMFDSSMDTSEQQTALNNGALECNSDENDEPMDDGRQSSPVSLLIGERRRSTTYFRIPENPKTFGKSVVSKLNLEDDYGSPNSPSTTTRNSLDTTNSFRGHNDDEDSDRRVNLRYITQRRGPSSRIASLHSMNGSTNGIGSDDIDDLEDDDETLMMNMQQQLRPHQQTQLIEQPERLNMQFDMNELLQLTPLKPLLRMNARMNNGPAQVNVEPELTATIQLTQRLPKPLESSESLSAMSTIKMQQNDLPSPMAVRCQESGGSSVQEKSFSDLTTTHMSSRIELPRLTDILGLTTDNHQQTQMILSPENGKQAEVQKRKRVMKQTEALHSGSDDNEEEMPVQRKKKPSQRKKKTKDKDPSAAKVVLQKLNETPRSSTQSESAKSERKHSDESVSSTRSSGLTRDPSSDSESSVASYSSKQISTRPRRQKAPKNLQEPNLSKKLRR